MERLAWQDEGSDTTHAECVSAHWREKYERDAGRSWDRFYGRHATNFFKDRHYLREAFPELAVAGARSLLDCGCGVGNALLPLLESSPELRVFACDISSTAITLLKADATFAALAAAGRCDAFVRDATADELPPPVQAQPADCALMLFVLSAIAPDKMLAAVRFAAAGLRPGGTFLFRDYGRYDHAQIRFGKGAKLRDHFVEFAAVADECKFSNCRHLTEPGCAVKEAIEAGTITEMRHDSYQRMRATLAGEELRGT